MQFKAGQAAVAPAAGIALKKQWVLHISSYPNENTRFYNSIWKYLNRPLGTVGEALKMADVPKGVMIPNGRWFYIDDQTQDYFAPLGMTLQQASDERARIKKELVALAARLQLQDATGSKKRVTHFRINVLMSEAVEYDIIDDLTAEFNHLFQAGPVPQPAGDDEDTDEENEED